MRLLTNRKRNKKICSCDNDSKFNTVHPELEREFAVT